MTVTDEGALAEMVLRANAGDARALDHRAAYVLCDVFDLANADAAGILEMSEETLRHRLSRARRSLEAFTASYCGLATREAQCRCSKRVAKAEQLGRISRGP